MHGAEAASTRSHDELREALGIGGAVHIQLGEALVLLVLRADQNVQPRGVQHLGGSVQVAVATERAGARRVQPPLPRNRHETGLRVRGEICLKPVELWGRPVGAMLPADGIERPCTLAGALSSRVQDDDVPRTGVKAVIALRGTNRGTEVLVGS